MTSWPIKYAAWTAYIDYLRVTMPLKTDNVDVELLYHEAVLSAGHLAGINANGVVRDKAMGYYGWRLGPAFWGKSGQGYMLQVSGVTAHNAFDRKVPVNNVARIDLQATYWYDRYYSGVAATVAELSNLARSRAKGARWLIRHINGMGNGDTCYIGRRGNSSKLIRCYDKWKESKESADWLHAWRYEVELADEHAKYAYLTLRETQATELDVLALMYLYCEERGIVLPYEEKATCYVKESIKRDPTTDERWLDWLKKGVRPSIDKKVAGGVSLALVLEALGIERDVEQTD